MSNIDCCDKMDRGFWECAVCQEMLHDRKYLIFF